jgi:hypothetical protein
MAAGWTKRGMQVWAAAIAMAMAGCAAPGVRPPAATAVGECTSEAIRLDAERQQKTAEQAQATLRGQIAGLQLQIVAEKAETARLSAALAMSKKQLDEAVIEVVRSKAKLGSIGSRAEAATALAESEALAKTLRSRSSASLKDPDYLGAERMLALGNQEFAAGNFGGAYYLASTARTALAVLAARSTSAVPAAEDARVELRFAAPIELAMSARVNLRDKPSTEGRAIRVVDRGAPVRGLAARDLWIRVELPDGMQGWVFHDLLIPR